MVVAQGDIAMSFDKIAFVAAPTPEAADARRKLVHTYGQCQTEDADVIVALGGDGVMLHSIHDYLSQGTPIYGMNRGSVGFLMNEFREDGLIERLARAEQIEMHPLRMVAEDLDGETHTQLAFNEVSLLRETRQAAKITISVDDVTRMEEMICDGVLVSTSAGSTAYNLSASGPIIPLGNDLLALTPISAFRPRHWRGALLPSKAKIIFEVLEPHDRCVSATADFNEIRNVVTVTVNEDRSVTARMLFDPEHNLEERVLKEQFSA